MWASYQGHTRIVEYLLNFGANVDALDEHGISSLSWASGRNHVEIVSLLLGAGASPNLCDKNNTSPLIWASRRGRKLYLTLVSAIFSYLGYTRVVDLLLKYNANVNNIGMKNMTALLAATKGGYAETALRLLENRTIDIKIQDKV
jgi:ankyrin repeat protein